MFQPPPVTRRGLAVRWLLTLLLAFLGLVVVASETPAAPPWFVIVEPISLLVCGVAITQRRSHPLRTAAIIAVLSIGSLMASAFIPWLLVSIGTRRRWREVLVVGIGAFAAMTIQTILFGTGAFHVTAAPGRAELARLLELATEIAFSAVFELMLLALGFYLGARRELMASLVARAETAEREQALKVEAARAGERTRIAREMHDVLAHRISLVSMHAGVLAFRDDLDPEQTRATAQIIQENAHASLTELRQVLSALREEGQGTGPQPTLDDLGELLEEGTAAGMRIELTDARPAGVRVPAGISRHAYRIVQEGLTNARKHAVGAPVWVSLCGAPGDGLTVEVRNLLTHGSDVAGAGLGLVGLAERAELVGGRLTAEVHRGEHVMEAWLPWEVDDE